MSTPIERAAAAIERCVGIFDTTFQDDAHAAFDSIDVDELARVITAHRIECTGIGEVTCYGCRDAGWMSWPAFHEHVARALKEHLTKGTNDE